MNKINLISRFTYNQILISSGIITIILFLVLSYFDIPLKTTVAPNGFISFELAKNIDTSISIISSWDLTAKINAGLSLGIDFLFLAVYSIFFASACFLIAQKFINQNDWLYKTGLLLAKLQFVVVLFDAIENVALIQLLLGSYNGLYSSIAYYFASIKFIIIAVCIIYIIIGLLTSLIQKRSVPNS